jgi:hypothetical protein
VNKRLSRLIFAGSLFAMVLSVGLFLKSGQAMALTQGISGDVSIGCPSGCQAVTNNPTSYYQIDSPNTGSATNIQITVSYPCSSNMGFSLKVLNGGGDPNYQDPNACASGNGSSVKVNFSMFTGSNCQPDPIPTLNECYATIYMTAIGASSGHFAYSLNVNGNADIADAASTSPGPTANPAGSDWPSGGWARQFGMFPQNVNFNFDTPCTMTAQFVYVAWAGVDYGSSYQPGNVSWQLTDNGSWVNSESNGQLDGNNPSNSTGVFSYGFWAYPGHTYSWSWTGIDQGHGGNEVVFSVPFTQNSFDLGQSCGPSWNLGNGGSVTPGTVTPGQSANFNEYVYNNGPDTATYQWKAQEWYAGISSPYDITSYAWISARSGGVNPNRTDNKVPWPNNTSAPDGSQYCQRLMYTYASGPNDTGQTIGVQLCVTLKRSTTPVVTCNSTFIPEADSDQQGNNVNIPPGSPSDNSPSNPDSWSNPQPPKATNTETTGALVTIAGTNASPASFWQGETLNPTTLHSPYTMNYVPSNPTISVTVGYYENALTHLGGNEWVLLATNTYNLSCLTTTLNTPAGSCSLSVSGGDGPGGVFTVGQSINVTGAIYNPGGSPTDIPLPASNADGNLNINFNGGEHDWGSPIPLGGSSGTISLGTVTANAGPNPTYQTITATPAYGGTLFPGACHITFPVYAPFTLTPNASVTLSPDPEDPSSVNNDTYVAEGGTTVSENVTSNLYEVPSQSSSTIPNGNTSSTGPFSPGSTTCLYQSPSPYNISGCDPSLSNGSYPPSTPLTAGDTYCATINVPATTVGSNIAYVGPQSGYSTIVGGAASSATSCPPVVNKPYFKVYGSGVASGGSFSGPADGLLADWNNNSGLYPDYDYGGGSELANLATGPIVGYASAQQSTNDVRPPADLNFANSGWSSGACSISTGSYTPNIGGCFGSAQPLLSELGLPNPAAWPGCLPAAAGTYNCTDGTTASPVNLTLGATTINDGQSVYLNVNGNVYINGPITYSGANAGSWNPNNVPSFILNVTGGNIYIAPGVGELDGLYVAEPNGSSGGIIYTCGQSDFTPMGGSTLYTGCNKQLTVYGSFEAQSVHMMRTYGSLRNETPVAAVAPVHITKNGKDYSSCTPIPPSGGAYACTNDGNSVWDYQEYGATYSLSGVPAGNNYNLNINYQNYQGNWPPPSSLSPPYYYVVDVLVNGTKVQTLSLPSNGGSYSVNLSSLPANPSITLDWLNNGYPPPGGSSAGGTDPGFVPAPGNPTAYDPNLEINSLVVSSTGTPPTPPSPLSCSNNGGSTAPRPTCAAEVFDYSPESSLSTPYTTGASKNANSAIEIYNLPPVL